MSKQEEINLEGKQILVAGGDGGVGSALVKALDEEGAECILTSHAKNYDGSHTHFYCDFTDEKSILQLGRKIKDKYGTIDGLIHAAGIGIYKPAEELTNDDWNNTMAINVDAPFILTRELIPLMKYSKLAVVLAMGSGAGIFPMKRRVAYCTSKFALRGLMLTFAEEFKDHRPHFVLMTFGSILTGFGPMTIKEKQERNKDGHAYFTPEWAAKKMVRIIRDPNREVEYKLFPEDYGFGQWRKKDQKRLRAK